MNIDGEMHFGELEEARPRAQLRPDANRHFAVERCGGPEQPGEVPVFLDLDVMLEMEEHAASDTRVELGGVVLGAQCLDGEGHPFVVVTDSLRAEHYQATKGSFKFTHDTWESITRRRDEFPPETELVGWYHTHPDWGVFLSGMDLFICEHFFARPLDVAIVIDPCRGDRGVFVWNRDKPGEIQRAAGFFVVTSRFRQAELARYIQHCEEGVIMRTYAASPMTTPGASAPIIQIADPRAPWLVAAVLGMMTIQLLAILLVVWRLALPASPEESSKQLARLVELIEEQHEQANRNLASTAKLQVLDRLLAQQDNLPGNVATKMAEQEMQLAQMRAALEGLDAAQRDARQQLGQRDAELAKLQASAKTRERNLQRKLDDALASRDSARERYRKLVADTGGNPEEADIDGVADTGLINRLPLSSIWIGGLAAAVVVVGVVLSLVMLRRRGEYPEDREREH